MSDTTKALPSNVGQRMRPNLQQDLWSGKASTFHNKTNVRTLASSYEKSFGQAIKSKHVRGS
jgi:hypothetical protein